MVLGIFASVAQYERELISKRTKDALAANKARGILSGTANSNYRIDEESKKQASIASARTRNRKVVESAEFACFCRILRKVIPILNENSTDEELFFLNWTKYRTSFVLSQYHKAEIKELMQEANRNNNKLFIGIDFTNANFISILVAAYKLRSIQFLNTKNIITYKLKDMRILQIALITQRVTSLT